VNGWREKDHMTTTGSVVILATEYESINEPLTVHQPQQHQQQQSLSIIDELV